MDYLRSGEITAPPPVSRIANAIHEHYDAMLGHYGQRQGVQIARKHLGWYCKDMPGSSELRAEVNRMADPSDVRNRLGIYFRTIEQRHGDALSFNPPTPVTDHGDSCAA
jgi:tRNA-dihydrouridine synthase B